MPNLRIACARIAAGMRVTSAPSTRTWPSSGFIRPSAHFSVTDLPTPEPPMTTSDLPGATSRSTPSSTCRPRSRFLMPMSWSFGPVIASLHEERCDEIIDGEDQHDRADDRIGGGASDAKRAALAVIALVGAHRCDDEAEHRGLGEAQDHV